MDVFFAALKVGPSGRVVGVDVGEKVFRELSRVLKRRGRLAISDIVSEQELPEGVTCDATLWASCIGGAMQMDQYKAAIEGQVSDWFRLKKIPTISLSPPPHRVPVRNPHKWTTTLVLGDTRKLRRAQRAWQVRL